MTVPQISELGTFVVRGGKWEPYINTRGQGFGQSPDRTLLLNASAFAAAARESANVSIATDGTIRALPDSHFAKESASSALSVQEADGSTSTDRPYVLNGAGWEALSNGEQINAVAAYATDRNCPTERVRVIAEALRDSKFAVAEDSLEATLSRWCAGEQPAAPEPAPSRGSGSQTCKPTLGFNDDGSCREPSDIDPSDPEDCPKTGPMPVDLRRLCYPK